MTERLFLEDAYLTTASATVLEAGPAGIVLDRTPFYARSGGQPGDAGTLHWDGGHLAVTEAITNVVRHAYPEGTGAFHITAAVTGREFWVLVADDGCGYQTASTRPGLGWGLTLIARLSEEYVITERASGGTEVRMRFPIPPSSPSV